MGPETESFLFIGWIGEWNANKPNEIIFQPPKTKQYWRLNI